MHTHPNHFICRWSLECRLPRTIQSSFRGSERWCAFFFFLSSWQKLQSLGRGNLNQENASTRLAHRQVYRTFYRLMIDMRGLSSLWAVPLLCRWAWEVHERQLNVSLRNKQVGSIPSGSLLQSLLWLLSLMGCELRKANWSKPFPLQVVLITVFIHSSREKTKRNASAVKGTHCSWRGPGLCSQYL